MWWTVHVQAHTPLGKWVDFWRNPFFNNQEIIQLMCSSSPFAFTILLIKSYWNPICLKNKFYAESGQIFWIITFGTHHKYDYLLLILQNSGKFCYLCIFQSLIAALKHSISQEEKTRQNNFEKLTYAFFSHTTFWRVPFIKGRIDNTRYIWILFKLKKIRNFLIFCSPLINNELYLPMYLPTFSLLYLL